MSYKGDGVAPANNARRVCIIQGDYYHYFDTLEEAGEFLGVDISRNRTGKRDFKVFDSYVLVLD